MNSNAKANRTLRGYFDPQHAVATYFKGHNHFDASPEQQQARSHNTMSHARMLNSHCRNQAIYDLALELSLHA